jgi:hypothetical protein
MPGEVWTNDVDSMVGLLALAMPTEYGLPGTPIPLLMLGTGDDCAWAVTPMAFCTDAAVVLEPPLTTPEVMAPLLGSFGSGGAPLFWFLLEVLIAVLYDCKLTWASCSSVKPVPGTTWPPI